MQTQVCMAEIVSSKINLLMSIQGNNHPAKLHFPEGAYFEGVGLCEGVIVYAIKNNGSQLNS